MLASVVACHHSDDGVTMRAPPGPGSWTPGAALAAARFEGAAAVVGDRIYYVGGITGIIGDQRSARASDRVDILDPASGTWSSGPALPDGGPRHHLAITVAGGKLYVLGGFTGIIGGAEAAGQFTPNAGTFVLEGSAWRRLADQPLARGSATAQAIGGILFVAGGGIAEPDARADLYAYDPAQDHWSRRAPMPTAREHVASCAIGGKMIVVGGWTDTKTVVSACESYDPSSDTWTRLPDLSTARGGLGAAALGNVCHAIGGEHWTGDHPGTFDYNEGFDTTTGRWQNFAPMPTARHGLGLTAKDGALYAIGGGPEMGNSYTNVVEIFRP